MEPLTMDAPSVVRSDTAWVEWRWTGTRADGTRMDARRDMKKAEVSQHELRQSAASARSAAIPIFGYRRAST